MVIRNIAELVQEALLEIGCDPSLFKKIDSHSAIELNFHDRPSIFVSQKEEEIWLWSRMAEPRDDVFDRLAPDLLKMLMQGYPFIRGEHPSLAANDGYLDLKVLVHDDYLSDGVRFAEALNSFFECTEKFSQIIR
ncbi:MAG: hypothetical protein IT497_02040 [Ottowia sp.]|nr:hypothetical protein [Ottowia sp.]